MSLFTIGLNSETILVAEFVSEVNFTHIPMPQPAAQK